MKILITDKNGQILYEGSPSLHGDGVVIGSGNDCDIQLNKMGISRRQIQLRYNSEGYLTLQDLQSPYGTIVNGNKIQPGFVSTINPGCFIELSDDVFDSLQLEGNENSISQDNERFFPFFLNSNESFVRKSFATIRSKIPRQYYPALSATEGEMVTRIKELSAVLEVSYALNSIASFPRLLDFTLEMAINVTGGERAVMMLYNEDLGRLETVAMINFANSEISEDMQVCSFLVSKCFDTGESIIGPSHNFRNPNSKLKSPEDVGILSVAIVPLKELSSNIGVLYIDTKHSGNIMTSRTDQMLKIFAAQASVAINRTKMYHSATTDPITGVANENLFMQRLAEEFCRSQRYRKDISMILMDLDHFSVINETYGEIIGNRVLKEVGKMFRSATRIHDLVARFGADSFAMLLPETPFSGALVAANKLKASLSQTKVRAGNQTIMVTGSFGISSSSVATTKPGDLLKLAEKSLKLARKRGGNQIA